MSIDGDQGSLDKVSFSESSKGWAHMKNYLNQLACWHRNQNVAIKTILTGLHKYPLGLKKRVHFVLMFLKVNEARVSRIPIRGLVFVKEREKTISAKFESLSHSFLPLTPPSSVKS